MGNPTGFHLTPGQAHDLDGFDVLMDEIPEGSHVLADKAYDADECVRKKLKQKKCIAVIPPKSNRNYPEYYDKEIYKDRHLIENFFAKLKLYRAIATRYDKTAHNFLGAIYLVASIIWLN